VAGERVDAGGYGLRIAVVAGGAAVLLAVLGGLTVALWPEPGPAARARQYRDVTACLLTGSAGVTTVEAAPVWAGMREASEGTGVKVRFLEVDGAQTAENAAGYLAGLLGGGCDVTFAVGQAPGVALTEAAVRYPRSRFVLVTAAATSATTAATATATTPRQVPLPAGMGNVIRPDGTVVPATHVQLVPGRSGPYRSAFPIVIGN